MIQSIKNGYLNLIIGPMFSGKSTRLIQYIRRYKTLDKKMIIIKPNIDTRYTLEDELCTHDNQKQKCVSLESNNLKIIFEDNNYSEAEIIIIEEGQFFTELYNIVKKMLDTDKKRVYIAALNGDYNRELFGDIHQLISQCDNIEFMQALCLDCKDGTPGCFTKRLSNNNSQILVAGNTEYKAVCRKHYFE